MSFLLQTHCLNDHDIAQTLETLDHLQHEWTRRAPSPLPIFTLGAATYLDARHDTAAYKLLAAEKNPVLRQHFKGLLDKLILTIRHELGHAEIEEGLALPGFHIFGNPKNRSLPQAICTVLENTPASIHIDTPYKNHLIHWMRYRKVDFLNPLSITVCLETPRQGAGLNLWHRVQAVTQMHGHAFVDDRIDRTRLALPSHHAYTAGWMYVSSGHQVHQIAPCKPFLPSDRRITLQAHAVMCDDAWRVFF